MSLPYDPRTDEVTAIAELYQYQTGRGRVDKCIRCKRRIWLNPTTINFMVRHECPAVCPACAVKFAKGEI